MKTSLKIVLFILCNMLGFFSSAMLMTLIVATDIVDISTLRLGQGSFADWFVPRVMFCWLICLFFSIAAFFVRGNLRFFFFLAPAVLPFIFGAGLIFMLASAG